MADFGIKRVTLPSSNLPAVNIIDTKKNKLIFNDYFETFSDWVTLGTGVVSRSNTQSLTGEYSLYKNTSGDPNGAYKLLGNTLTRGWSINIWIYSETGRTTVGDRIGVFDASGNGYSFFVSETSIGIDVRTSYTATSILSKSYTRTNGVWYNAELVSNLDNTFTLNLYNTNSELIDTLTTPQNTIHLGPFDRVAVLGGIGYYVDSLTVYKTFLKEMVYFLRYRITSEDKNRQSHWSPIFRVVAPPVRDKLTSQEIANLKNLINIDTSQLPGVIRIDWTLPQSINNLKEFDVYYRSSYNTSTPFVFGGTVSANSFSAIIQDIGTGFEVAVQIPTFPKIRFEDATIFVKNTNE